MERYKNEMMKMYSSRAVSSDYVSTVAQATAVSTENDEKAEASADGKGYLVGIVTALRELYPVENAKVTVFTGDYADMKVIAEDFTDQSGRTKRFELAAPAKFESLSATAGSEPFSRYNMLVRAEGYVDNIHLNIPVFSGVVSLQRSNMMLLETSSDNQPQIFDEAERYNL